MGVARVKLRARRGLGLGDVTRGRPFYG
jgi:hypothetical protein